MASKAELALILSLVDDVSKTAKGVGKELTSVGKIGQGLQGTMVSLGKVGFAAVAAGAAIAVASVTALGAASWKAARELDDAFDAIVIGTGAAGAELEGLKDDFRTVFADFPGEASVVAGVLSEVNTRLGLTGEAAQDLTLNIAQAARMMGGDAVAQTQKFARVMGDWDITTDDATNTLDKFFVMSQATGAGMEDLMAKVVQFGAPMRLMGFTLEDSIALFGKWEKEGVNAELVMGSLRIAAGKFAKEGKPLRESLLATFDAIQKTDDASWALQHGMEIFGARAGPDMVAAIREGRFAFEDLLETMGDVDGAILATAAATEDWGEKWQRIKNRITLALEPIGMAMMNVAGQVLDALMPAFEKIGPLIDTHIMPAVNRISQAFDVFFRGLEMWQSPLEAFKDVLWTLLPPQMASQIIGVIDWLGTLIGAIKEGDWEAAGGMIWEQIQIGIEKGVSSVKGLGEMLREKLSERFIKPGLVIDTDTGDWIEVKDDSWQAIGRSIVDGVVTGAENAIDRLGEILAAFRRWAQSPDTAKKMQDVGYALTDQLISAIEGLFDDPQVAATWIGRMDEALGKAFGDLMGGAQAIAAAAIRGAASRAWDDLQHTPGSVRRWWNENMFPEGAFDRSAPIDDTAATDALNELATETVRQAESSGLVRDAQANVITEMGNQITKSCDLRDAQEMLEQEIDLSRGALNEWSGDLSTEGTRAAASLWSMHQASEQYARWMRQQSQMRVPESGLPSNVPLFARGTDWFRGGTALVGERGPELVHLPRGSAVTSNDEMRGMGGDTYVTIEAGAIQVTALDPKEASIGVLEGLRSAGVAV